MKKRNLVAVILMLSMSVCLFAGCTGNEAVNEPADSETVSVEETVNIDVPEAEEVSETINEENTEAVSEEESSEAVEEVAEDYSITAIEARINEIAGSYPNEDSRQIAAVVIGTNVKYMTEEEVEEALNTYEFTKEEVNELFIQYFETKGEMILLHDDILGGLDYVMPDYAAMSPVYLYCLNCDEYEECLVMENAVVSAFENKTSFQDAKERQIINDDKSRSVAKMIVYGTSTSFVEYYPECLPFVTE